MKRTRRNTKRVKRSRSRVRRSKSRVRKRKVRRTKKRKSNKKKTKKRGNMELQHKTSFEIEFPGPWKKRKNKDGLIEFVQDFEPALPEPEPSGYDSDPDDGDEGAGITAAQARKLNIDRSSGKPGGLKRTHRLWEF